MFEIVALAFLFGSIMGSFLNVVILRLHTGRSLSGRSRCMSCGEGLHVRDLFPVMSYIFLRGRCRTCTSRISARYISVEVVTGILFALVAWKFFAAPFLMALMAVVAALLVVVFVYDMRHTIIPNELMIYLLGAALVYILYEWTQGIASIDLLYGALAALCASGIFATLWYVSGGRWIGLGDAKLMLPLGLLLSPSGTLSFIVLAFWLGTLSVGVIALARAVITRLVHRRFSLPRYTMRSEVPFGPFLIVGFFIVLFGNVDILTLTQTFADATTRLIYQWTLP